MGSAAWHDLMNPPSWAERFISQRDKQLRCSKDAKLHLQTAVIFEGKLPSQSVGCYSWCQRSNCWSTDLVLFLFHLLKDTSAGWINADQQILNWSTWAKRLCPTPPPDSSQAERSFVILTLLWLALSRFTCWQLSQDQTLESCNAILTKLHRLTTCRCVSLGNKKGWKQVWKKQLITCTLI